MGLGLGPSGLIRLAVLAGLGLSLLLSGCASTAPQKAVTTSSGVLSRQKTGQPLKSIVHTSASSAG